MRWSPALALGVLLAAAAGRAADPPRKAAPTAEADLQRFQGTWQVEAWVEAGTPVPAADLKARTAFFGSDVFVFRRDGKLHQAGMVTLDPARTPAALDLAVKQGPGRETTLPGVYALAGDTLTLCFDPDAQTRPGGLKPAAKDGFTVVTLRKPRPPADEQLEIAGKYRSELIEPTGKVVVTEAKVERRGDGYLVTYTLDGKLLFVGTALRKGDQLSMCWISAGQSGVSVYKIEKGPKLVGTYTVLGGIGVTGKEVLTPWKQID